MQAKKKFSILITTKNRKNDLNLTLQKIQHLLSREDVECIICDDGSSDETFSFVKQNYPHIQVIQNNVSKGLIYSRNRLMNLVTSEYAISIDDDLHFITQDPLEIIENAFHQNSKIGLLGFRIFWNPEEPETNINSEVSHRMKSFVGCGNVWRMEAWRDIPDYPAWFIFYGEEDFASYQLFKKKWKIYYLPEVLVNHRVDIKSRKKNPDYYIRQRRSLRSGWYLYFLFYPLRCIPKKMMYSIWIQLKTKVFKGDLKALVVMILATFDLFWAMPKIIKNSNRLSLEEYSDYKNLIDTKLYWEPENNNI